VAVPTRRGGLVGALGTLTRRIVGGRPAPAAARPEAIELAPDAQAVASRAPTEAANRDAAETARRLDEARDRLRATTPPPDSEG
jgi:hypothetical protein